MTLRKIVGALIICAIFTAMTVAYSIAFGHWWFGPLLMLAGLSLGALLAVAAWLVAGGGRCPASPTSN